MTTSTSDPVAMSPEERFAELAAAFATGYLRLSKSRRKALEAGRQPEALCALVNGAETPREEFAWKKT